MDYASGIEAMILAILQQTTYSQQIELAELTDVVLQTTQDDIVANGLLLTAYADYLAAALAENADVTSIIQTSLLNITTTSILPVSDDLLSAHVLADQRPFGFSHAIAGLYTLLLRIQAWLLCCTVSRGTTSSAFACHCGQHFSSS